MARLAPPGRPANHLVQLFELIFHLYKMISVSIRQRTRATQRPWLDPGLRRVVGVVMIGAAMPFLDSTIVNVALRQLSAGLHASLGSVQWTVTGYLLAFAVVIPVTGWAARRAGAARIYLVALAVFTAGSGLCALSGSLGELVLARVLQGAGGGMIMPAATIIWVRMAGPGRMARVMSAVGAAIVLAPMLGPTLGGVLVEHAGWRSIFLLNLPVGAAGIALAARLLPRDEPGGAGPLDFTGLLLAAAGMAAFTYWMAEATAGGVRAWQAALGVAAGLVLLAGFVMREMRIPHPLLEMRLYRNAAFSAATVISFAIGMAMFGGMILMPLYFQIVRGQSVIVTGLLLAPSGIGAAAASRAAAPLTERFGGGPTALAGGLIGTAATVPFMLLGAHTSYLTLSAAMAVRGAGTGLALTPALTAAYGSLRPAEISHASPQMNILQRLGGSIGTALFTVILQHQLQLAAGGPQAQASAFGVAFRWVLAVTAAAVVPAVVLTVTGNHGHPGGSRPVGTG
jgi:EmrB/QacA subfamily drug resistance transporter